MFEAYDDFKEGLDHPIEKRDEEADMTAVIQLVHEIDNGENGAEKLRQLQEYTSNMNYAHAVRQRANDEYHKIVEDGRR